MYLNKYTSTPRHQSVSQTDRGVVLHGLGRGGTDVWLADVCRCVAKGGRRGGGVRAELRAVCGVESHLLLSTKGVPLGMVAWR